jgi:hypothetical protein
MATKQITPRFIFVVSLVFIAVAMRLIPHWPNFTPVAAIALFGGTYISRKWLAFLIPIAAMLISDAIIGFHNYLISVYVCFAIAVGIGLLLRNKVNVWTVGGASLFSSVLFFLITNFAVWLGSPFYSQDITGLINCYALGIPFFNNGVLGDLFYNMVFFGGFYLAQLKFPVLARI